MLKAYPHSPKFHCKRLPPQDAIKAHCRHCKGEVPATCVCFECQLYDYHMSMDSSELKKNPLKAIQVRRDCAESFEGVNTCTASKLVDGQAVCVLWPYRDGGENVVQRFNALSCGQSVVGG